MSFDKLVNAVVIIGTIIATVFLVLNVGKSMTNDFKTTGMTPADFDAMKSSIEDLNNQTETADFEESIESTVVNIDDDTMKKNKKGIEDKKKTSENGTNSAEIKEIDNIEEP